MLVLGVVGLAEIVEDGDRLDDAGDGRLAERGHARGDHGATAGERLEAVATIPSEPRSESH